MSRTYSVVPGILIVCILAFALAGCCGGGGTARTGVTPAASGTPAATAVAGQSACAVGARCIAGSTALTVNSVTTQDSVGGISANQGFTYLVIDVTIENLGAEQLPYSPLYFKVKASDGTEYNATVLTPEPSLKSGDLPPGEIARGNVAFEVPTTASGFVATYEPLTINSRPIRVDLGR